MCDKRPVHTSPAEAGARACGLGHVISPRLRAPKINCVERDTCTEAENTSARPRTRACLRLTLSLTRRWPCSHGPCTPPLVDMPPTAGRLDRSENGRWSCACKPRTRGPHTAPGTRLPRPGTQEQTAPASCWCPGRLAVSRGRSPHLHQQRKPLT